MSLTKKIVLTGTAFLFFILLMAVNGIGIRPEADSAAAAKTDSRKTDGLFRDMGVTKVPRIIPPVDIDLLDFNGKPVRLSDFKGKIVFLNFWTTWCYDCRIEMPSLEKLHNRLKKKDFVVIAVNLREPALRVRDFFKENHLTFTALLDSNGEAGLRFGIRSIPTTFVLDRDGGIIGKAYGPRKWNSEKSVALFEHLINNSDNTLS